MKHFNEKALQNGCRETWLARWTGSAFRLGIGRTADRSGISHIPTNKSWNKESDSMPSEGQKLDSTRWAWPPVDEGNTNTSTQWSTMSCHQVVFACAFGAVSTTRGEACFSTMKTWGNYRIAFSTSPWGYGLQNHISITLFEVHLSWACWPASHMQYIYMRMMLLHILNIAFVLVSNATTRTYHPLQNISNVAIVLQENMFVV